MKCELSCCLEVENPVMQDIPKALEQLVGFLRDNAVGDDLFISQFELAAAEAINNAAEHGCANSKKRFFQARLYLKPEYVELRVIDPSDFGGWKEDPILPDDPLSDGGRGYFIMKHMTDELIHEWENGCHVLILRKRFNQSPWRYSPGRADKMVAEMADEVVSSFEMINTLVDLGEWLAMAPDRSSFLDGALKKLCTVTGADTAYVRIEEKKELRLLRQWGASLKVPDRAVKIIDPSIESHVFVTGREITLPEDSLIAKNDPIFGIMLSEFVSPVVFKDKYRGVLVMGRTKQAPYFDAGQLKVARMVADYIGIIVTLSELQKRHTSDQLALRDLEIASQLQLSLMPSAFSSFHALDLYGTCRPALQAGGDYFDIISLPDTSLLCVIADVMGKGLPAALLSTMLRTNLYAIVASGVSDPSEVISKINHLMSKDLMKLEMFITMTCAWISPDRSMIYNASAGHLPTILQKAGGRIDEIEGMGIPLGIFHDNVYASQSIPFEIGDRMLLYTDGIIETMTSDDTMFNLTGLKRFLKISLDKKYSSLETVAGLLNEIEVFSENKPAADDRTVIIVSRMQ